MGYSARGNGDAALKPGTDMAELEDKLERLIRRNSSEIEFMYDDKFLYFWDNDDHWHEKDTMEFLDTLTPYITEGNIDYTGEDDGFFRYRFVPSEKCWKEESGKIYYTDEDMIAELESKGYKVDYDLDAYHSLKECASAILSGVEDDQKFCEEEFGLFRDWHETKGFSEEDRAYVEACGYDIYQFEPSTPEMKVMIREETVTGGHSYTNVYMLNDNTDIEAELKKQLQKDIEWFNSIKSEYEQKIYDSRAMISDGNYCIHYSICTVRNQPEGD